ncbi:UNVERIFIED_CONTAM: hypothetical protein Sindi_2659500 [Sesamum indicum]
MQEYSLTYLGFSPDANAFKGSRLQTQAIISHLAAVDITHNTPHDTSSSAPVLLHCFYWVDDVPRFIRFRHGNGLLHFALDLVRSDYLRVKSKWTTIADMVLLGIVSTRSPKQYGELSE